MSRFRSFALLCLCLLLTPWVLAQDSAPSSDVDPLSEDCVEAYIFADKDQVFQLCSEAAELFGREAMYTLGLLYDEGTGVKADPVKAAEWFRKAADEGQADAAFQMGRLSEEGKVIPLDLRSALHWYKTAADGGVKDAPARLAALQARIQQDPSLVADSAPAANGVFECKPNTENTATDCDYSGLYALTIPVAAKISTVGAKLTATAGKIEFTSELIHGTGAPSDYVAAVRRSLPLTSDILFEREGNFSGVPTILLGYCLSDPYGNRQRRISYYNPMLGEALVRTITMPASATGEDCKGSPEVSEQWQMFNPVIEQTTFAPDFARRIAAEGPPDTVSRVESNPGPIWNIDRRVGVCYRMDANDGVLSETLRDGVPLVSIGNGAHQIRVSRWPENMTLKQLADEMYTFAGYLGCTAAGCKLQSNTTETFRGEVAQRLEMTGRLRSHWTVIVTQDTRHGLLLAGTGEPDISDLEKRVEFITPLSSSSD